MTEQPRLGPLIARDDYERVEFDYRPADGLTVRLFGPSRFATVRQVRQVIVHDDGSLSLSTEPAPEDRS